MSSLRAILPSRFDEGDLDQAAAVLSECGVPTRYPIFHDWIPGKSLYFEDIDGHELELSAPSRPSLREPSSGEGASKGRQPRRLSVDRRSVILEWFGHRIEGISVPEVDGHWRVIGVEGGPACVLPKQKDGYRTSNPLARLPKLDQGPKHPSRSVARG